MDNKSTKFIKSNKRFFVEDAVESFTFSDDSDDEGMGTSSKNYKKSFSRGNDSKGGRKYDPSASSVTPLFGKRYRLVT